ncbi:MAG: hypothetical protein ACE5K0_05870 [Candidatus Methanofastidiosia archaeon]
MRKFLVFVVLVGLVLGMVGTFQGFAKDVDSPRLELSSVNLEKLDGDLWYKWEFRVNPRGVIHDLKIHDIKIILEKDSAPKGEEPLPESEEQKKVRESVGSPGVPDWNGEAGIEPDGRYFIYFENYKYNYPIDIKNWKKIKFTFISKKRKIKFRYYFSVRIDGNTTYLVPGGNRLQDNPPSIEDLPIVTWKYRGRGGAPCLPTEGGAYASVPSSFEGIPPVLTDTGNPYIGDIQTVITQDNVVISAEAKPSASEQCYFWTVVQTPDNTFEIDADFDPELYSADVVTTEGEVGEAFTSFDGETMGMEIPLDILGDPDEISVKFGVYDCELEEDVFESEPVTVTNEFARYETLLEGVQDAVDTVVERLDEAEESGLETIDTEIVQMTLVSVEPILVEAKNIYPTISISDCTTEVETLESFFETITTTEEIFNDGAYGPALEGYTQAQEMLEELGYPSIAESLEQKKKECEKNVHLKNDEADRLYLGGVKKYKADDKKGAKENFGKALELYENDGNEKMAEKCKKYLRLIDGDAGIETILVLLGIFIALVFLRRRK